MSETETRMEDAGVEPSAEEAPTQTEAESKSPRPFDREVRLEGAKKASGFRLGRWGSWASLIGIPIGVVGLLSVGWSQRSPDMRIEVDPSRTPIIRNGASGLDITISYDGEPVTGDVTSVQFTARNDGDREVRAADILTDARVYFEPEVKVIDARILDQSREKVTQFKLDMRQAGDGVVGLAWNIMEGGDWAKVQLTFAGYPSAEIKAAGDFIGHQVWTVADETTKKDPFSLPIVPVVVLLGIGLVFLFLGIHVLHKFAELWRIDWAKTELGKAQVTLKKAEAAVKEFDHIPTAEDIEELRKLVAGWSERVDREMKPLPWTLHWVLGIGGLLVAGTALALLLLFGMITAMR